MTDFQLAVLGDHVGGLAAAVLALRRGWRVLLLETQEGGAVRPLELLNATAGHPDQEPVLRRFFHDVGLAPFGPLGDDWIHFRPLLPALQVCAAHHRLTCHTERTARTFELQREFGDDHRLLAPLWQREEELHARLARFAFADTGGSALPLKAVGGVPGFVRLHALEREFRRESFADFLQGQGLPADVEAVLAAQAQAVIRRPAALVSWVEGLRGLRVGLGGLYRNAAGQSGLLTGLRTAFLSLGGEARPLVAVEGTDVPRTGPVRLHLAAAGDVRAERVLFDLPLDQAAALLPEETAKALRRKGLEEGETYGYGLLELELAPGRRPEVMGDYLAIAPPDGAPSGPAVLVAVASAKGDPILGSCRIEALTFFPSGVESGGREHLEDRLRSVIPFLDESQTGDSCYTHGTQVRWSRERLGLRQRGERLAAGWAASPFCQGPLTFLRNGDYAGVSLTEALLTGMLAVI